MIRTVKLCLLSLLAVMLCASAGQAAVSDVSVLGNGNLTTSGGSPYWGSGGSSISGTWLDLTADDVVVDPTDSATDSGSMTKTYKLFGVYPLSGYETTVTADLTVEEMLSTDNLGDKASDDITITLQMLNGSGTVVDSDSFTVANVYEDGADLGPATTSVLLSVTNPSDASVLGYSTYVQIRLIVDGAVEAFTAPQSTQDPDPNPTPSVPAPGAIALASLGMGLVNWLRTRRSL